MSDSARYPAKPGPTLPERVEEVRGLFPSDSALQQAISRLAMSGIDRADISVLDSSLTGAQRTPETGLDNPNTEDDARQQRTLHASMAGSVGALTAAGAVIATGGAALPAVAAAVAGGVGLGAAAEGVTRAGDRVQNESRNDAAAQGRLVLAVRLREAAGEADVRTILRESGASEIARVVSSATADSSSWTG